MRLDEVSSSIETYRQRY